MICTKNTNQNVIHFIIWDNTQFKNFYTFRKNQKHSQNNFKAHKAIVDGKYSLSIANENNQRNIASNATNIYGIRNL